MGFFEDIGVEISETFDETYLNTPLRRLNVDLPDGYYTGYVESFQLIKANNDRIYLRIDFIVMEGPMKGFRATKWNRIELDKPEVTAKRIKSDLIMLGYDWKGVRSLGDPRKWAKVKGAIMQFQVTHQKSSRKNAQGPIMSVWIRRRVRKPIVTQEEKDTCPVRNEYPPEREENFHVTEENDQR